jgi:hypothetical protein
MNCERCQKNLARVRVDQVVEGRREHHYLCQQCVDELMKALSEQAGGTNNLFDATFGITSENFAAAAEQAATARQQEKAEKTLQKCSLVYKDGHTFLLNIHSDYIDPEFIPQDSTLGDNDPLETTYRVKASLEKEGWVQTGAGQAATNPNCHYWNFTRDADN